MGKTNEDAALSYDAEFPLASVMEDLKEFQENLSSAWVEFAGLDVYLGEGIVFEAYENDMRELKKFISKAEDCTERLKKVMPEKAGSYDLSVENSKTLIKIWTKRLDANVTSANSAIFSIVAENKWDKNIPQEYKTLYKVLIEKTKEFYNMSGLLDKSNFEVIPRTKDVFGKLIHDKTKLPSATDGNSDLEWMTPEQFANGMKSEEIKEAKKSKFSFRECLNEAEERIAIAEFENYLNESAIDARNDASQIEEAKRIHKVLAWACKGGKLDANETDERLRQYVENGGAMK